MGHFLVVYSKQHLQNKFGANAMDWFALPLSHIDKPLLGVSTESESRPCQGTPAVLCESPAACKGTFPILQAERAPGTLNTWLIPWEAFPAMLFQQPVRQQQIGCVDTSVSPSPCL